MTKNSDFKAVVRARMKKTGERYAAARASIATDRPAPDIPEAAERAVHALLDAIDQASPGLLVGFHLVGSVASGDFRPGRSDVDFVAVLDRPLDAAAFEMLVRSHRSNATRPPLDGIYTTREQLREGTTPEARFHDGVLVAFDDYGATPVTRRELATIGKSVRGSLEQLDIENDTLVLKRWVRQNLDTYWTDWIRRASGWSTLAIYALLPRGFEWSVLGITRMLYTLETGQVTSKHGVAAWALGRSEDRWHDLLRTAEKVREGSSGNPMTWIERREQALAYMSSVLASAPHPPD